MSARLIIRRGGLPDRSVNLVEGRSGVVGRAPGADVSVPDEPNLGKRHASVLLAGGVLRVERLSDAPGPVYRDGAAAESFTLEPGGSFVVGHTRFVFDNA